MSNRKRLYDQVARALAAVVGAAILGSLMLHRCYICRMATEVPSRELRNNTAGLLRRVRAGEQIVVTVRGRPVASLVPFERGRRGWIARAELLRRLAHVQSDPGLREDLDRLAGETTDELGPVA